LAIFNKIRKWNAIQSRYAKTCLLKSLKLEQHLFDLQLKLRNILLKQEFYKFMDEIIVLSGESSEEVKD
jgi:hypothetical protein